MKARIGIGAETFEVDFSQPLDISLTLCHSPENPIAWYLDKPEINPVVSGDFIGKVSTGKSSTNFNNIFFNPHGHGTHTECLGHITNDFYSVNDSLNEFIFLAQLISVEPENIDGDLVIKQQQIKDCLVQNIEALVIRTLPNNASKTTRKYSNTNPPYLSEDAAVLIRECGVKHLLIDLPSVDKEHDEGQLVAHKAFWNVTNVQELNMDARKDCTITELIFVSDSIPDGKYLLNLQMAAFNNDAAPSRPILYKLEIL